MGFRFIFVSFLVEEEILVNRGRRYCGLGFGRRLFLNIKMYVFYVNGIAGEEVCESIFRRDGRVLIWI